MTAMFENFIYLYQALSREIPYDFLFDIYSILDGIIHAIISDLTLHFLLVYWSSTQTQY